MSQKIVLYMSNFEPDKKFLREMKKRCGSTSNYKDMKVRLNPYMIEFIEKHLEVYCGEQCYCSVVKTGKTTKKTLAYLEEIKYNSDDTYWSIIHRNQRFVGAEELVYFDMVVDPVTHHVKFNAKKGEAPLDWV